MRRYVPVLIGGMALIAAGCRDSFAPPTESPAAQLIRLGDRSYSKVVSESDTTNAVTTTFDIPAAGGKVQVGEFTMDFAPNSVCDPLTSDYGPDYWLVDCQTLDRDFTITARFFDVDGESHVELKPDIRFHPERVVTIAVRRVEIINQQLTMELMEKYGVWNTRVVDGVRYYIDEAWQDASLITHFDTNNGRVWRRIRHYTGWVIRTGYCTEYPEDPICVEGAGGAGIQ